MYEDGKWKKLYCFLMILGYSRMRYATKRKAELAFDQMEADLLAQVRQYPDLAA